MGKPDLVFPSVRSVVFVDGDFWHGRHLEERIARGDFKTNKEYWISKLRRNRERDKWVNRALADEGWLVIRVWESEVQADLEAVTDHIVGVLAGAVSALGGPRRGRVVE